MPKDRRIITPPLVERRRVTQDLDPRFRGRIYARGIGGYKLVLAAHEVVDLPVLHTPGHHVPPGANSEVILRQIPELQGSWVGLHDGPWEAYEIGHVARWLGGDICVREEETAGERA